MTDTSDAAARIRGQLPDGAPWRIAVVGAGSVGSQIADSLARHGIRHLTLVDPDTVSAANLSRSVYRQADIGRPKVAALAEHLQAVAGDALDLRAIQDDVGHLLDDAGAIRDLDLVVLATDDPMAELEVNTVCYRHGVAMVSVKLYRGAEAAELAWVAPHRHSPCLRCLSAGRGATYHRRTDYGTGRLLGEPALGTDIAVVVPQGTRMALALLADRDTDPTGGDEARAGGPAAWFDHVARRGKVMAVTANVPGWPLFAAMHDGLWCDPWATIWIRAGRSPDCPICGWATTAPAQALMRDRLLGETRHRPEAHHDDHGGGGTRSHRRSTEPGTTSGLGCSHPSAPGPDATGRTPASGQ